jgi:hypothetical protein
MKFKNTETNKIFDITKGNNQFDAQEDGGTQKGHIDYEIDGATMLLHTIYSSPEKGTGLGSLLLCLAVKNAMERKCTLVKILSAAPDARDFYFAMGCRANTDSLSTSQKIGAFFNFGEGKILVQQCPLDGAAMTVFDAAHASMIKRWEPE